MNLAFVLRQVDSDAPTTQRREKFHRVGFLTADAYNLYVAARVKEHEQSGYTVVSQEEHRVRLVNGYEVTDFHRERWELVGG